MNKSSKIIAALLIIVVVAAGTYAYMQSSQPPIQPSPSSTATPTTSPSQTQQTTAPSPTQTPTTAPTQVPSTSPTSEPTATPLLTAPPTLTPTPAPAPTPSPVTLTVSSTTSLHDTGLEDVGPDSIKSVFQAKYPWITLNFLAQGTGAAIQTAMRGDADMIMVHDPVQENAFLTGGYGVNRKIIAYNFYVIVGPADDPAKIAGMAPIDAMKKIFSLAQNNTPGILWVSRNDSSGTYSKEKSLWTATGLNINTLAQQSSWFKSTGSGMGQSLLVANQFNGYILSDAGTYLSYYTEGNIQLKTIVQAQKDLLNVYSAVADNPRNANLTDKDFEAEMLFIKWLVSDEGQQIIGDYGKTTYGQALFSPFMPLVNGAAPNATLLSWIQGYAYIPANATECPAAYRYNAGDLYSMPYDALPSVKPQIQLSQNVLSQTPLCDCATFVCHALQTVSGCKTARL